MPSSSDGSSTPQFFGPPDGDGDGNPDQNTSILDNDLSVGLATASPIAMVLIVVGVLLARARSGKNPADGNPAGSKPTTNAPWLANSKVGSCTDMSVSTIMTDPELGVGDTNGDGLREQEHEAGVEPAKAAWLQRE